MLKIKKTITSQDKFGSRIEFCYKKNSNYKTFFGGLFSLVINVFAVFICYIFGQELWLKRSPNSVVSEEPVQQPERFIMNPQSFVFVFGMEDSNWTHYIDESVYTIEAINEQAEKVQNLTTGQFERKPINVNLNPHKCTKEDIKAFNVTGTEQYFKELPGIENMYCLDQTKMTYIEGDFTSDSFANIQIAIKPCRNLTEAQEKEYKLEGKKFPTVCKDQKIIDKQLSNAVFAAYFTDKVVDPTNLDHPFTNVPRDMFWPVTNQNNLAKEITIYQRNIYIESDVGIINEQIDTTRSTIFSYQTEQVIYGGDRFARIVLRFEKGKQTRYYRSYLKVQDILANVSGVTDLFVVIGCLICLPLSQLDLSKDLVNEVYTFQKTDQEIEEHIQTENNKKGRTQEEIQIDNVVKRITSKQAKEIAKIDLNIVSQLSPNNFVDSPKDFRINNVDNNMNIPPGIPEQNITNAIGQMVDNFTVGGGVQSGGPDARMSVKMNKIKDKNFFQKQQDEVLSNYIKSYNKNDKNNQNDQEIEKLFKFNKEHIELKGTEYLSIFLCPCKKKSQKKKRLIEHTRELLDDHLDVLYIINKLLEVDKLKLLLLNKDQLKLFSYLPKPKIKNEDIYNKYEKKSNSIPESDLEKQNLDFVFMDKRTNLQKALDAYEAFNNVKKQEKKNKIDMKLIQLLDPKILEYFSDNNAPEDTIQGSPFFKKVNTDTKQSLGNNKGGINKSIFLPTENQKDFEQQKNSEKDNNCKLMEYYFYAQDQIEGLQAQQIPQCKAYLKHLNS